MEHDLPGLDRGERALIIMSIMVSMDIVLNGIILIVIYAVIIKAGSIEGKGRQCLFRIL